MGAWAETYGGLGDGPLQNLRWGTAHAFVPPIFREVVLVFYCFARLKAISAPHAGDLLLPLPIASCGLRLDDETVRVAAGLRLGVPLCELQGCPCGAPVAADGHHGLSCPLGPGRLLRHAALNDLVFRSLVRASYPSTKEPTGLLTIDGRRPDGQTLIPRRGGKNLV